MCLHFPVLFLFFLILLMLFLHLRLSNFQAQLHCPLLTCFGAYFSISRWLLVIWLPFHPNSNLMSAFQHHIINGCFCACAPVRVYVDKANQPQIQYKYKSTNDVPTHHCWSVNIPTSQTPCSANYMDPDWLTPRDAAWWKSARACVCVYTCGSLVIQQAFQLSEGKSWVREQLPNQRSASSTVGQWHASQASASQWWMYWLMLHRRAHTHFHTGVHFYKK